MLLSLFIKWIVGMDVINWVNFLKLVNKIDILLCFLGMVFFFFFKFFMMFVGRIL